MAISLPRIKLVESRQAYRRAHETLDELTTRFEGSPPPLLMVCQIDVQVDSFPSFHALSLP